MTNTMKTHTTEEPSRKMYETFSFQVLLNQRENSASCDQLMIKPTLDLGHEKVLIQ